MTTTPGEPLALPSVARHARALAQDDARVRPARYRGPVGFLGHLEIINASDMLVNRKTDQIRDARVGGDRIGA
jgi:hypothetical protein